ncbi:MAG: peroxiredoxin [Chlamydiae bacterium]|nr:peroxiredoxin [Chlamydiota bacterium]
MSAVLVGKKAPVWQSRAVWGEKIIEAFSLDPLLGKYVVLLFYPLDFTFVCPTELHAFQEQQEAFAQRNAQVVACSVDSCYSHKAWLDTPRAKGGIEGVSYPLVADLKKTIAMDYHVLEEKEGVALRGLFIIDPEGFIRHQLVNDLPIGRSVDEVLRTLDALIHHKEHGEVCPAGWRPGHKAMKPNTDGLKNYFQ